MSYIIQRESILAEKWDLLFFFQFIFLSQKFTVILKRKKKLILHLKIHFKYSSEI